MKKVYSLPKAFRIGKTLCLIKKYFLLLLIAFKNLFFVSKIFEF